MVTKNLLDKLKKELNNSKSLGLLKKERIILKNQGSRIKVGKGTEVLNFCANNYLGLSSDTRVISAAKRTLDKYGYGMSSVRFICGTQSIHKELEDRLSNFLLTEDTILYAAAFDANGGFFEPLFDKEDAIISDSLNHASIIDGIRLCKAVRYRYQNNNMQDLESKLIESKAQRNRVIVTDGVFSMDGYVAKLDQICDLAEKYNALVMVDDCHSTGFLGKTGRGTHEHCGVIGRVDIITSTLGKALGGAMGGFTSGKKEIIDILRQKSRPYLFSNSLAPSIVGASIEVLNIIEKTTKYRDQLEFNSNYFRSKIKEIGFEIKSGTHPIVPIMLYDAKLSQKMSERLLEEGVYVVGFFFPVVPKGEARIRVQISASHTKKQIDTALNIFQKIGKELNII